MQQTTLSPSACLLRRSRSWALNVCLFAAFSGAAVVCLVLAAAPSSAAQDRPGIPSTDALLRLVPPDAAVVLTVDGLRGRLRAFTASELYAGLRQLPAVKAWIESEKARELNRSRDQIETVLGVKLNEVCDDLLGDAVVLALRLAPAAPADSSQARGLLLFQARDRSLLERLVQAVNARQKEGGELGQIIDRKHGGTTYHMREFPPAAGRPPEWYITYPDGLFAFSNSEHLIQSVIDRKGNGEPRSSPEPSGVRDASASEINHGVNDLTRFQAVKRRLPAKALARLFVEPRQIERLIAASPQPNKASEPRILPMLERYLAAVDYAGAALVWNDAGIEVRMVETLTPGKLDPWLSRWAGADTRPDPIRSRAPETTLALAAGQLDAPALYEALFQIVPDAEHPKLRNLESVLSGLLLGQELRTRILPQLGPGVLAYVELPPETLEEVPAGNANRSASAPPFAQVLVVDLKKDQAPAAGSAIAPGSVTTAAAIQNALRTVLSLSALDEKRNGGRSRITTRLVAGANVTTLDFPISFAYALDSAGSRVILGTSAEAVASYLKSASNPSAGERFRQLKGRAFPDEETYLCVDLAALGKLTSRRHDRLVELLARRNNRPVTQVDHDLTQVLAFAKLFDAAYLTSRFEPDSSAVHRRIGLMTPNPKPAQPRP